MVAQTIAQIDHLASPKGLVEVAIPGSRLPVIATVVMCDATMTVITGPIGRSGSRMRGTANVTTVTVSLEMTSLETPDETASLLVSATRQGSARTGIVTVETLNLGTVSEIETLQESQGRVTSAKTPR
jgi:hypothetical protein